MPHLYKSLILFFVGILPFSLMAQSKVLESLTMTSAILKKEKRFAIYLPAGYDASNQRYPVLYLLHGGSSDHRAWIELGGMQRTTDEAIKNDKAVPMIVVMPDAEMTFYMNNAQGNYQFEDYFFKELIPYIEQHYRCRNEKQYRAIAGLSMGGFGSLLYSIHHPEMFASCAAFSSAVRTDEQINEMALDQYRERYKTPMGEVKNGEPRITEFWNQNSILYLMNAMPEKQKNAVRFYLDCGDDDHLYKGNALLHITMRDRNIPHEYRVRDGGHTWEYWRSALPTALEFISATFK